MALRYQAAQAAAMSRAVPGSSSAATMGPAATVSGDACGAVISRRRPNAAVQGATQSRATSAGIQPSPSSAATFIVCWPRAAIQIGNPGTGGWPSRSGRAAGSGLDGQPVEQRADRGHDVAQPGGRAIERDVMKPLRQGPGAGPQAQHVPPRTDLVQGGGG